LREGWIGQCRAQRHDPAVTVAQEQYRTSGGFGSYDREQVANVKFK
jgi:hypothetical protein